MAAPSTTPPTTSASVIPEGEAFERHLSGRHLRGRVWQIFFFLSIAVGMLALFALLFNVINDVFGLTAVKVARDPQTLTEDGAALETLSNEQLANILVDNLAVNRVLVLIRDNIVAEDTETPITQLALSEFPGEFNYPEGTGELTLRDLSTEQLEAILASNLNAGALLSLVNVEVVGRRVVEAWPLLDSLFDRPSIEAEIAAASEAVANETATEAQEDLAGTSLEFRSWVNPTFLFRPMSSTPAEAGVRTALLGSIWLITLTILFAFPIGVGAAIYLEEYASGHNWFERFIETNIRNLAGVPSIIYGLLGLAIFVRTLGDITGGRTILSGALTMALLILPLIIINAQEALRAVPYSIREASFGLGATRWQTIWNQVLPAAMPGILTGTILGISRALGETAPIIVVGASTFILVDPNSPLDKFTALPIQIYDWTKRPDAQFRDIAAATIVVLLVVLLSLNATAIILRQRFRRKLQG